MKIPKKIRINGFDWKIVDNKKRDGGSFNYKTRTIEVDRKSTEKESILFHEIMEILTAEQRIRFGGSTDNHYRFFMTHDDFTRYSDSLYATLKDNKLLK